MSIIPQDSKLFDRSVYANATYGLEQVPHDEVQTLPVGLKLERLQRQQGACWLDAGVGKDGLDLSGGERQRILLARAILQARPLLLLDEATSALDAQTEAAVLPCAVAARAPARYHHRGGQPQAACAAGGVSHAGTGPGCDTLKPRISARRPRRPRPRPAWAAGSARSGRSAAGTDTTIPGRCRRRRA